jgi:transposase
MGRPSKYPAEFRAEAVRLVLTTDKSIASVARDLGISDKTLAGWVRKDREKQILDALPGALNEHTGG